MLSPKGNPYPPRDNEYSRCGIWRLQIRAYFRQKGFLCSGIRVDIWNSLYRRENDELRYQMFFIFGISQREDKLDFHQTFICPCCSSYGRMEVFYAYSYFSLFFIPLFKWNKRYYVKTSCCGAECEIPLALGNAIKRGEIAFLNTDNLPFSRRTRRCPKCGYIPADDSFEYCPRCGAKLWGNLFYIQSFLLEQIGPCRFSSRGADAWTRSFVSL